MKHFHQGRLSCQPSWRIGAGLAVSQMRQLYQAYK